MATVLAKVESSHFSYKLSALGSSGVGLNVAYSDATCCYLTQLALVICWFFSSLGMDCDGNSWRQIYTPACKSIS